MTNTKKLTALYEYFTKGGSDKEADVMQFLETTSADVVKEYMDALDEKYPEGFAPEKETEYFLKEDGLLKKLLFVKQTNDRVILEIDEPKSLVKIILKGEVVEVDLFKLEKLSPSDALYGTTVAQVIALAELAQI